MTSNHKSPGLDFTGNNGLESNAPTQAPSTLESISHSLLAPFTHRTTDSSSKLLADLAPSILTPNMVRHAASRTSRPQGTYAIKPKYTFNALGRAPLRLALRRNVTAQDLEILEATSALLSAEIPTPTGIAANVSLLEGFKATIPSSERGKTRRRRMREVELSGEDEFGFRKLSLQARGLLTEEPHEDSVSGRKRGTRRLRESLAASKILGKEELNRQKREIQQDKQNLHVRRKLIQADIGDITNKIKSLENIRSQLESDLLRLQEEELELDDELEGVNERGEFEGIDSTADGAAGWRPSRRRRGPAFLPSEHDDLPRSVAFMTLAAHSAPITALDFSEPYGLLVTAAQDESARLWDLCSGEELGFLRGHTGVVKCLQVEQTTCISGGSDGTVRIWDLNAVEEEEEALMNTSVATSPRSTLPSIPDEHENDDDKDSAVLVERPAHASFPRGCVRTLEGHSKGVSAIYFEDACLVSGASDKTIRQWDINTGQCVLTMDILWAISHTPSAPPSRSSKSAKGAFAVPGLGGASLLSAASSSFAVPAPPNADGSWDMYSDFVGGVQFWGYALVSGSGDGAVRMWDMRTGQAHRTLVGHTAPVTCLQFDELHIVSGSLDKTVRIWDLRTGGIAETIRYDHPVSSLQFDSRKIISCAGDNSIKIYNRTSMQQTSLTTNGHTKPVEKLRFMDRYMVSGGRDSVVKVWAL